MNDFTERDEHVYRLGYIAGYTRHKRKYAAGNAEDIKEHYDKLGSIKELLDTLSGVLTRYKIPKESTAWDVLEGYLGSIALPFKSVNKKISKGSLVQYLDEVGVEAHGVLTAFIDYVPGHGQKWFVAPRNGGPEVERLITPSMVTRFGPVPKRPKGRG